MAFLNPNRPHPGRRWRATATFGLAATAVMACKGSQALVEKAKSTDKTLKVYSGVEHDLLHEPEGPKIASEIVDWLQARLPVAATAVTRQI